MAIDIRPMTTLPARVILVDEGPCVILWIWPDAPG